MQRHPPRLRHRDHLAHLEDRARDVGRVDLELDRARIRQRRARTGMVSTIGTGSAQRVLGRPRRVAEDEKGRANESASARYWTGHGREASVARRGAASGGPNHMSKIQTPQPIRGMQSLLGEEADRFHAVVAAFDRVRTPLRLQAGRSAGARTDRGVRADDGRDHRRRLEGNVFVRGPLGRRGHAAPRIHRRDCARLSVRRLAAVRAAQGRHPRPGVPLRAPAKGPLPPVPPARRRDHRRRRTAGRRRTARLRRATARRTRHRRRDAQAQHARRRRQPRRVARRA